MNAVTRLIPSVRTLALAAGLAATVGAAHAQSVVRGPFIRGAGDTTRYYVIQMPNPSNWTTLRNFARGMGGDLATIDDAAENTFIRTTVLANGEKAFIGLNDAATEGTFVWSDGSTAAYRNWAVGEPTSDPQDDYALILQNDGRWQAKPISWTPQAVVEVKGAVRVPGEAPTLQAGLQLAAQSSNEVLLAPGTYQFNQQVLITTQNQTIRGSGAGNTIISSNVDLRTFDVAGNLTLADLTVQARSTTEVFRTASNQPITIRALRCNFTSLIGRSNDEIFNMQGGNLLLLDSCDVFDTDVLFSLNNTSQQFRAVNTVFRDINRVAIGSGGATHEFTNCVIARTFNERLVPDNSTVNLRNTILWNLVGTGFAFSTPSYWFCLTQTPVGGVGGRVGEPQFVNAAQNDFRLLPGSPAIDAGSIEWFMRSNATDFIDKTGGLRAVESISSPNIGQGILPIDIGAFEFTSNQGCDDVDFNNDGLEFDPTDLEAFFSVYSGGPCLF